MLDVLAAFPEMLACSDVGVLCNEPVLGFVVEEASLLADSLMSRLARSVLLFWIGDCHGVADELDALAVSWTETVAF